MNEAHTHTALLNTTEISATYTINNCKIKFDSDRWTWVAINEFGFGVGSNLDLNELEKIITQ